MASYEIRGLKIQSERYGQLNFLYAYFNAFNPRPTSGFANLAALTLSAPYCPFEQTIFCVSAEGTYPNYQYLTYFRNYGFPNLFPMTLEGTNGFFGSTIEGKTYYDVWKFSNSDKQYYVFRGVSGNSRWIILNEDLQNTTTTQIRFTVPCNANITPATTIFSYNPNLDASHLQAVAFATNYNGTSLTVQRQSGTSDTQIPFVTSFTLGNTAEKTFFENLPNDLKKDPYAGGGTSTSGGGHGDFNTMTDSMSEPSYDPVESFNRGYANHGFAKVYLPTSAQLLSLHNYLWSSSLDNTLKKMYASPIDCIISLNMIPLDLSSILGDPVNQENIVIGNVDTQIENVNVPYTQFIMLDCGTISISEFFGSYLDYSPYTKLSIYLPYIGMKELDIDDFMNGEIGVKYYIDIVSGDCVAYINQVNLSSNDVRPAIAGGAGVLYQFNGNVAFNVPISAQNFSQIYAASAGAMIGGAGMLVSALSGGMSAPMALTGIAATGVNVATSKPSISRGGSIPSTAGYLGIQVPYLILTRPRQCLPEDQNALVGYPAYVTVTVGDIMGYNEFEMVHLENIPATDAEKAEIEKLLKSGVIL